MLVGDCGMRFTFMKLQRNLRYTPASKALLVDIVKVLLRHAKELRVERAKLSKILEKLAFEIPHDGELLYPRLQVWIFWL